MAVEESPLAENVGMTIRIPMGYVAWVARARGKSRTELFNCVFLAQLWFVAQAKKGGLRRPRFLDEVGKLRISDSMIYWSQD